MDKFMKFCTFPVIYRNLHGAFGGKPIKPKHSFEVLFFVGTKLGETNSKPLNPRDPRIRC